MSEQFSHSERARGLEKSGSSHCGGDPLVLCTKDCPLLGQLNFSHLFPFEKRHYVKYDCCRPIKVEWGILNLSFSVLGKMPVILSLRFPGRINKDFSSVW